MFEEKKKIMMMHLVILWQFCAGFSWSVCGIGVLIKATVLFEWKTIS